FRGAAAMQAVDFTRDIQPIFEAACYGCHGPKSARGQLRLDDRKSALKGGISGAAIIPGDAGKSLLMRRILGEGGEARMPMGGAPLKAAEIELIRKWINQGAVWPEDGQSAIGDFKSQISQHWAYVKPVRPLLPKTRDQARNLSWARNPIDHFIMARL